MPAFPRRHPGARKNGVFAFKRSGGDTTVPLTVYFYVSGTAQSGVAYKPLRGEYAGAIHSVTFGANQTELLFKVKALDATLPTVPETVTLTLLPSQDGAGFVRSVNAHGCDGRH